MDYYLLIAHDLALLALCIFALVFFIRILIAIFGTKLPQAILDHWETYFPDFQLSSIDFYSSLQETLGKREIPHIEFLEVKFSERGSFFDRQRLYLRIRNAPYLFDVCAAQYGTGFFVSWWFGQRVGLFWRILFVIPYFGKVFKRRYFLKTYYKQDCEAAFRQAIHLAVLETIDALSDSIFLSFNIRKIVFAFLYVI